jgi:hypothetical protein
MEDMDFSAAMQAPAGPEPQARMAQVSEDPFIDEITLPVTTDTRPTALSLVPYEERVKLLVIQARDLVVNDEEGRKKATELGLQAKKTRLKVEAIKKSPMFQAAESFIKDIRHLCNTLTDPLSKNVEQVCKAKLTAYSEHLRLAKAREEAEARERARAAQAELDAEAAKLRQEAAAKVAAAQEELARKEAEGAGWGAANPDEKALLEQTVEEEKAAAASIVSPQVMVQVQPEKNVVRTDEGASFTTSRWVAEVIDLNLVDRKYLVLDPKAIQKDVDGGLRQAAGFIIKEKLGTSFRG